MIVFLFAMGFHFVLGNKRLEAHGTCKENEISFLNKCFCEPGWSSISVDNLNCILPVMKNGECECEPKDILRSFLKNSTWIHSLNDARCTSLCKWNNQVGVARSQAKEWKINQVDRQLDFYKTDLPKGEKSHLKLRLDELATGFDKWSYLNNSNLGSVVEFGAGGYTQLRNIMERVNVTITDVTLVDTQIYDYQAIPGCTFQSGSFQVNNRSYPTIFSNATIETFLSTSISDVVNKNRSSTHGNSHSVLSIHSHMKRKHTNSHIKQYDTVICMNVLVYALDAFQFLETLYHSVKPGGLLLFHDRWFENSAESSKCRSSGFGLNVVQVCKPLLEHFISQFEATPFLSTKQTKEQIMRGSIWCKGQDNETAYYAAVRKPLLAVKI